MNNSGQHQEIGAVGLGLSRAARALAALPVTSPTVGFKLRQRDLEGRFGHGSDGALHKSKLQMFALGFSKGCGET